ncbi:hypothetical protein L873DRAFT_440399 [Choiromyces venosus 120613-1]|uniref:Uncharacterized protein n=1 Tax=Choiromyces venosus 120613-1 TaxID=1336337 RepID=A0A3N4J044_9PEZI|nr:hypothetical protein L873DRAFT_440399 [Choiromyces venosus 120613-1]
MGIILHICLCTICYSFQEVNLVIIGYYNCRIILQSKRILYIFLPVCIDFLALLRVTFYFIFTLYSYLHGEYTAEDRVSAQLRVQQVQYECTATHTAGCTVNHTTTKLNT